MRSEPNLLIVGEPKSGTSSLHVYLEQHPDIFMTKSKESHYFDKDLHRESDSFHKRKLSFRCRTKSRYLSYFRNTEGYKVRGESTPTYMVSKSAARLIRKFNPDMKIIMILREPVDLLYSFHSQLLFNQDEDIEDFEEALKAEAARKKSWKGIPDTAVTPTFLFYSEFAKYAEQIKRYQALFPKGQIMILLFDELVKDTPSVIKRVYRFLGVDPGFVPNRKVVNPNQRIKYKSLHRLFFRLKTSRLKNFMPLFIRKLIIPNVVKITGEVAKRPKLDPRVKKRLQKKFIGEVKKAGKLIGKDLVKLWGY